MLVGPLGFSAFDVPSKFASAAGVRVPLGAVTESSLGARLVVAPGRMGRRCFGSVTSPPLYGAVPVPRSSAGVAWPAISDSAAEVSCVGRYTAVGPGERV